MPGRNRLLSCLAVTTVALFLQGCGDSEVVDEPGVATIDVRALAKEILAHRKNATQTDLLASQYPDLDRDTAIDIQLAMLQLEQISGERLIGWKMGGTGAASADQFDPIFGYVLESNDLSRGDTFSLSRAPGESLKVEAEVGFVLNRDLTNGVESIEELTASVDYVVGAVEIVQPVVVGKDGSAANPADVVASGVANLAIIRGSVHVALADFDELAEAGKCEVDGVVVAEGTATKIYGGPLNALFALANLLPQHGAYLKKGQLVIAGSLYQNPVVNSAADVTVAFSTLGEISFAVGAAQD